MSLIAIFFQTKSAKIIWFLVVWLGFTAVGILINPLMSPDIKTLGNTNTMQLILCARILIQQTLHKPDSQTQDQSVVFSPCLSSSPSTCLSSCLLTGLEPWTSKSCPQQCWRPGGRNPARLDHPVPGCCYSSQLCSLCCLLGYNLTKGKGEKSKFM